MRYENNEIGVINAGLDEGWLKGPRKAKRERTVERDCDRSQAIMRWSCGPFGQNEESSCRAMQPPCKVEEFADGRGSNPARHLQCLTELIDDLQAVALCASYLNRRLSLNDFKPLSSTECGPNVTTMRPHRTTHSRLPRPPSVEQ